MKLRVIFACPVLAGSAKTRLFIVTLSTSSKTPSILAETILPKLSLSSNTTVTPALIVKASEGQFARTAGSALL